MEQELIDASLNNFSTRVKDIGAHAAKSEEGGYLSNQVGGKVNQASGGGVYLDRGGDEIQGGG